ncbi:MAG: DUF4124 domain-containing protein [Gammaproteobacteria bacterium]|nr:DUF4124 domain-containing protein [Gammaproteobacteria bacterium]
MSSPYTLAFATILLALISTASSAAIYKWKDESGQVHYGSAPPSGSQAQKMGISTHFSSPAPASPKASPNSSNKKTDKPAAAADKKDPYTQKQHDSLCNKARNDIATLNQAGRLRVKQEDGSSTVMTEKSRNEREKTMQKMISKHCQ